MTLIVTAFIVFVSIPSVLASGEGELNGSELVIPNAEQVEVAMSPTHQTRVGTSTALFEKRLQWGGGRTSTYKVRYHDGYTQDSFRDDNANYYAHNYRKTYTKSLSISQ